MIANEKGSRERSPIPNSVLADSKEYTPSLIAFQASVLASRFGLLPETAATVATLAFVSGVRACG